MLRPCTQIQLLDERLSRLRARQAAGDPDMEANELQAAISKVEAKRAELQAAQPAARQSVRILSMLPRAAASYRKQVQAGLDGDERAMAQAHLILRDLRGPITLTPGKKGELWASYRLNPAALVKTAGSRGRGDRI